MASTKSKLEPTGEEACIVINNSFSSLEAFHPRAIQAVRDKLTYENQEALQQIKQVRVSLSFAFRYKRFKQVRALKAQLAELEGQTTVCWLRGNTFPTGHLNLVREALAGGRWGYNILDLRENQALRVEYRWANPLPAPRYFQDEMVALGVAEHRGVFESCVGSGKTYVSQLLIHALQVPALVVLPAKDLAVQTYDEYAKAFGAKSVALITSPKEAKTKAPIRVCTVQTLTSLRKKNALEGLLRGAGMVCIDEAHHMGASTYVELLPYFDHIYYRFAFSGTWTRNDSKTLDMWGFISNVLYRYSAAQAIKDGFLTPLKVLVHDVEGVKSKKYQTEYTKNYCGNPALLDAVEEVFIKHVAPGDQVLILVGRKETSGVILHEHLKSLGIKNVYVDGDSDKDVKKQAIADFNAKRISVLIGSSVLGEGIDIRASDHLINLAGGKSPIAVTQAVGRLVRLYPGKKIALLHDFRFKNTRFMLKHLKQRLEIYKTNFDGDVPCTE